MKGLEPSRIATPEPKSGASTNFATSACVEVDYSPFLTRKPLQCNLTPVLAQ